MPRTPRRRPTARRTLPPRPVIDHVHPASTAAVAASHGPGQQPGSRRVARGLSEREARLLIADMKRVAVVTATCLGLLVVLVVVDRLARPPGSDGASRGGATAGAARPPPPRSPPQSTSSFRCRPLGRCARGRRRQAAQAIACIARPRLPSVAQVIAATIAPASAEPASAPTMKRKEAARKLGSRMAERRR